jgi:hypothetical protein
MTMGAMAMLGMLVEFLNPLGLLFAHSSDTNSLDQDLAQIGTGISGHIFQLPTISIYFLISQ